MTELPGALSQTLLEANALLDSLLKRVEQSSTPLETEKVVQDAIDRATLASKAFEPKLAALNKWAAEMNLPPFSLTLLDTSEIAPAQLKPVVEKIILNRTGQDMEIKMSGLERPLRFARVSPGEMSEEERHGYLDHFKLLHKHYQAEADADGLKHIALLEERFGQSRDNSYWVAVSASPSGAYHWGDPLAEEELTKLFQAAAHDHQASQLSQSEIQRQLGLTRLLPEKIDDTILKSVQEWEKRIAEFEAGGRYQES